MHDEIGKRKTGLGETNANAEERIRKLQSYNGSTRRKILCDDEENGTRIKGKPLVKIKNVRLCLCFCRKIMKPGKYGPKKSSVVVWILKRPIKK